MQQRVYIHQTLLHVFAHYCMYGWMDECMYVCMCSKFIIFFFFIILIKKVLLFSEELIEVHHRQVQVVDDPEVLQCRDRHQDRPSVQSGMHGLQVNLGYIICSACYLTRCLSRLYNINIDVEKCTYNLRGKIDEKTHLHIG